MSSASTDLMMLDCFRRDPNVALAELPDLGSMSMGGSSDFTSEDWQEAFIQIGEDHEGGADLPSGLQLAQRKATDTSSFGNFAPCDALV